MHMCTKIFFANTGWLLQLLISLSTVHPLGCLKIVKKRISALRRKWSPFYNPKVWMWDKSFPLCQHNANLVKSAMNSPWWTSRYKSLKFHYRRSFVSVNSLYLESRFSINWKSVWSFLLKTSPSTMTWSLNGNQGFIRSEYIKIAFKWISLNLNPISRRKNKEDNWS